MHRIKIMGLAIVAGLAMSAVATSGASASPGYVACAKASPKGSGPYNDKKCTVHSKGGAKEGDYEVLGWSGGKEGSSPKLSIKGGATTFFSHIPGVGIAGTVTCEKSKGTGQITGPATGNLTIKFEKCESAGFECTTPGQSKAGTIQTNLVDTELAETGGKVVIRVNTGGGAYAKFSCEGHLTVTMVGKADGVIGPAGLPTFSKDSSETFSVNAAGEQQNTVHGDSLDSEIVSESFTGTLPTGEQATFTVENKEEIGISG